MDHRLYRRTPAMLHSMGPDGLIEEVSDTWLAWLGYERGEVVGQRLGRFLTPESARQLQDVLLPHLAGGGQCADVACEFVHRDGRVLHVLLSASTDPPLVGLAPRTLVVLEDVSRQKELESFFRMSVDLMCVADFDGYFRELNEAWTQTLGYPLGEMIDQLFLSFVHPDDIAETCAEMERLREGAHTLQFVNRYRTRDGEYRWLSWKAAPRADEQKIYAVARDVTEQRRQAEEHKRLEERLAQSQKLESLALLAGGIAHDFNNLLMGVLGNADLALTAMAPGSPGTAELDRIRQATHRAADLCRQLLAYSGKSSFDVREVDLSDLVQEMSQLLSVSISKEVTLTREIAPGLPLVRADVNQLRQVVMNLITNGSEAIGRRGGDLTVATGRHELVAGEGRSELFGRQLEAGTYVFLEVRDTGSGMDEATRRRMFDPLFTTKLTGRGLGLASVLGIVRGHGGGICVESEPGRGTCIRVLLPIAEEQTLNEVEVTPATPSAGSGTILLADDEETVRSVTRRMLERSGFDVVIAKDGRIATELFREEPGRFRAVILDMTMPNMDGRAALSELRRIDADAVVVLSSGYGEEEAARRIGPEERFDAFLQKPFDRCTLLGAVNRALQRAAGADGGTSAARR